MAEAKSRHELKYTVSIAETLLLKSRALPLMRPDPHVGADGVYTIRSLYFDDYENRCYFENENGTDPREKYRIRIYNGSDRRILLECKRKERGKTQKTSCLLTREQAERLIDCRPFDPSEELHPVLRKFSVEMRVRLFRPAVIVEYERIPLVYANGNVRVTFDTNVSSSSDFESFFSASISKRPIMPVGQQLMEVKYDEYLPDFIYRALNLSALRQTTYSKYYLCRKYSIKK